MMYKFGPQYWGCPYQACEVETFFFGSQLSACDGVNSDSDHNGSTASSFCAQIHFHNPFDMINIRFESAIGVECPFHTHLILSQGIQVACILSARSKPILLGYTEFKLLPATQQGSTRPDPPNPRVLFLHDFRSFGSRTNRVNQRLVFRMPVVQKRNQGFPLPMLLDTVVDLRILNIFLAASMADVTT